MAPEWLVIFSTQKRLFNSRATLSLATSHSMQISLSSKLLQRENVFFYSVRREQSAWPKLSRQFCSTHHTSTWSLRWKASSSSKSFLVRMQPSGSAITWPASLASALSPSAPSSPSNSSDELCVETFQGSSAIVSEINYLLGKLTWGLKKCQIHVCGKKKKRKERKYKNSLKMPTKSHFLILYLAFMSFTGISKIWIVPNLWLFSLLTGNKLASFKVPTI